MKKFFIAICFLSAFLSNADAKITPLKDYTGSLQATPRDAAPKNTVMSYEEFSSYVKESFIKSKKVSKEQLKSNNTSVIPGIYHQKQIEENKKSIFEKIYENAVKRISDNKTVQRNDVTVNRNLPIQNVRQQQQQWQQNNIPTINIKLPPHGTLTKVPAMEHIPYMVTAIEVLNNGWVKMEETIVIIANAEKLRYGLTKILPAKIYNAQGKGKNIDYTIVNVTRNDQPVDYHFVSLGDNIGLIPSDNTPLPAGVYTYKFEYLVDNLLVDNDDSYMLAWNIGGFGWNMVIDRLGATLILPEKDALIDQQVLLGYPNMYTDDVNISRNGLSGISYIAKRPMFIGEGMYLVASIDKSAIIPFSLWQRFIHIFYNYSDVIFASLGCLFISLSLLISWHFIKQQKKIQKITLPKTPIIMRHLLFGKFDIASIGSFLLDIYRKNIIDIQQSDDTILLIKRTDNLKSLNKQEQAALQKIFPAHETVFSVNKNNRLMFSRFSNKLKSDLKKQMIRFGIRLNIGYFLLSFAMLLITETVIAYFKISPLFTFGISATVSLTCGIFLMLWNLSFRNWIKIILRLFIIDVCVCGWILISAVINPIAAAIIILTTIIIAIALHYYGKRYGLIRYYIEDVKNYRDNLIKNSENMILGKNFLNYQSAIFALDLSKEIEPIKKEEYYKIPIIENICNIMK